MGCLTLVGLPRLLFVKQNFEIGAGWRSDAPSLVALKGWGTLLNETPANPAGCQGVLEPRPPPAPSRQGPETRQVIGGGGRCSFPGAGRGHVGGWGGQEAEEDGDTEARTMYVR